MMIFNWFYSSRFLLLWLLMLSAATAFAADFKQLDAELAKKPYYDKQKEHEINQLRVQLQSFAAADYENRFRLSLQLYNEYKSFQFDSAYVYADKMTALSKLLKDQHKTAFSEVKTGFILLSAGMFRETFDVLHSINVPLLNDSAKFEYYALMARANYDLAAFDHDRQYTPYYNKLASRYLDSAIAISQPGSYQQVYNHGYQLYKNGQQAQAEVILRKLLQNSVLSQHQTAIVSSTLSNVYFAQNKTEAGIDMLVKAVVNDIQSATKETVALFWLAQKLYQQGDVKNAYQYLQKAMADAEFYGARQRQVQISSVLPIVAAQNLNLIEKEKTRFLIYLISTTILTILLVLVSIKFFRQIKDLRAKETIIEDKNTELKLFNQKLVEDTHIKEQYIGYFFDLISGYILKLEKLKRSVDMKLSVKKYEDIPAIINAIQIKKERELLFHTFDQVFLKIFPDFVASFNALFREEDQIWPKENEVLTTDLRIFALIRLGISDNETIAKILEYSVKTIYVYKMRMKAKSLVQGEEFEHRIMAIEAVKQLSA